MGEAIFSVLQIFGFFVGKRLLPRLSNGRMVVMPRDAGVDRFSLAPYHRLPDGKIGVDGLLIGSVLALLFVLVFVGLCCLIL